MKKSKILVVEDELFIAEDIKAILEEDYDVFINIVNYDQAIKAIETIQPNLVLIDVKIKGQKDGIELGQKLLNNDTIPFIYITSFTDDVTIERIKNTRPYGFISIPFKKIDLKTQVYLTINNFSHWKIDLLRCDKEILDEVPITIRNIISYINQNIYEKIEIEELAKLTRWKKHHFIRTFTKEIGVTPYQYILKKKIDLAKSLIKESNQPINEIAYDLGFVNYGNFGYIFKKLCNNTPENYRRANMQLKISQK